MTTFFDISKLNNVQIEEYPSTENATQHIFKVGDFKPKTSPPTHRHTRLELVKSGR